MDISFESSKPTLIYVFRINDEAHSDCLKVGETTLREDVEDLFSIEPNAEILNTAARQRIDQYTKTAGIAYELLYTELTIHHKGDTVCSFSDRDVHKVLLNTDIHRKEFKGDSGKGTEWFTTDLETVKNAIKAVKEGRQSLTAKEVTTDNSPIIFRPEQQEAIDKTIKQYNGGHLKALNTFLYHRSNNLRAYLPSAYSPHAMG